MISQKSILKNLYRSLKVFNIYISLNLIQMYIEAMTKTNLTIIYTKEQALEVQKVLGPYIRSFKTSFDIHESNFDDAFDFLNLKQIIQFSQ
jgi:hypothetical protein